MILIIGINELLGQTLLAHLQESGADVTGWDTADIEQWADLDCESKGFLDVELLSGKLNGVSIVINCASFTSYLKSDYHRLLKINVEGAANLVNACIENEVDHLIQMSHIEAFGYFEQEIIQDEEEIKVDNLQRSFYGLSRFLGDLEFHRGAAEGLRVTIFNCGYLFDQENNSQPAFETMLNKGFKSSLKGANGYLFLTEAIKAIDMVLQKDDLKFDQYILLSKVMRHQDVLQKIAGSDGPQFSEGGMGFLKRWTLGKQLSNGIGYSRDYLNQMNRTYNYDTTRFKSELEFSEQN